MRIAIIGAGPAGLACAQELERLNIYPVIYEKMHRPGSLYPNVILHLNPWSRPLSDPLKYLAKNYRINLPIHYTITRLQMKSPRKETVLDGNLGFSILKGQDPQSIENHLAAKLQSPIIFNQYLDYKQLSGEFDKLVIATGQPEWAQEKGLWQETVGSWIKGATVLGDFEPSTVYSWFNTDYAKSGFVYLVPISSRQGVLLLTVPYTNQKEIEALWQKFWQIEKPPYDIIQTFISTHAAGIIKKPAVENLIFIGAAGGLTEPFMGFALINSLISGFLAARAIASGKDYNKMSAHLYQDLSKLLPYRQRLDSINNDQLDKVIASIGLPGIKQLLYKTSLNSLCALTPLLKVANYIFKPKNQYK